MQKIRRGPWIMATEAVLLPGNFLFSISSKFLEMLVASVMARFLKYKFRTLGVKRMALTAQEIIFNFYIDVTECHWFSQCLECI